MLLNQKVAKCSLLTEIRRLNDKSFSGQPLVLVPSATVPSVPKINCLGKDLVLRMRLRFRVRNVLELKISGQEVGNKIIYIKIH